MPRQRLAPTLSSKRLRGLLAVYVLAALCLSSAAAAQSGRRNTKKSPPPPPDAAGGAQTDKPAGRVTSVIICGHDTSKEIKEEYSNSVSTLVKAFTAAFERPPAPPVGVLNGGKKTRAEAVERAKRERGAYVLWFGYSQKLVGLFYTSVEHIDYVVFMPQTAEVLTEGRVHPDRQKTTVDPGGIMRLPTSRRRQRIPDTGDQLEAGGREIAARVRKKL